MVYFLVGGMLVSLIYVKLQYASYTILCEHMLL